MIVVDGSALVAIFLGEPEAASFTALLRSTAVPRLSAATLTETLIVLTGRTGRDTSTDVECYLGGVAAEVVPVDRRQAFAAHRAFLRFGKGRSAASLNYGDCFSYALAKLLDVPLLFKGEDFARTDITPAL